MSNVNVRVKPVWRLNTGIEPNDRKEAGWVMYKAGGILQEGYRYYSWSLLDHGIAPIYAYETTRTKAAKHEKVGCFACRGIGKVLAVYESHTACQDCKGHGHTWESIK